MNRLVLLVFTIFISLPLLSQELKSKVYNKKGKLIQRNRINVFGKLEQDINGIAIIRYEYEKGRLTKKIYYDKNDKMYLPDTTKKEFPEYPSYTLYFYNDEDQLAQVTNHYANGALMDLYYKPAIKRLKYNQKKLLAEEINMDKKGKLRGVGEHDVAIQKYTYNFKDLLIEEVSYDKNNKVIDFGMDMAKHTYDNNNRRIQSSYFFANSNLYHTDKFFYNEAGQMIKEESYNRGSKLEYTLYFTYDSKGQLIRREFKYPDGKVVTQRAGIELKLPGWKLANDIVITDVNDVDAEGSILITVNKEGKITEVKNSSCKTALLYAAYPFVSQLTLVRDEKEPVPAARGEIKLCIMNPNHMVEEY